MELNDKGVPKVLAQFYPTVGGGQLGGQKTPKVKPEKEQLTETTTVTGSSTTTRDITTITESRTSTTNSTGSSTTTVTEPATSMPATTTIPRLVEVPTTTITVREAGEAESSDNRRD